MTKNEREQQRHMMNALEQLGFDASEREALRRISMTLHRWHELECGDSNEHKSWSIERDEETNRPYMVEHMHVQARPGGSIYSNNGTYRTRIPDRETGARKRLAAIIEARNKRHECGRGYIAEGVDCFIQGDPRGAALYILRPGDVPEGADPSAYYSRGICVY